MPSTPNQVVKLEVGDEVEVYKDLHADPVKFRVTNVEPGDEAAANITVRYLSARPEHKNDQVSKYIHEVDLKKTSDSFTGEGVRVSIYAAEGMNALASFELI